MRGDTELFSAELFRLRDPAVDATGQTDLFTDIVRRFGAKGRELPVVEDAKVVELLLDRGRYACELLEVVGNAARTRQCLEAETAVLLVGRDCFSDGVNRSAGVYAHLALSAR